MDAVFLVDAMAIFYRSHFALLRTGMKAPDGKPTAAVFGFAASLLRVLTDHPVGWIASARDLPHPTFRHELHPGYKANRDPMPEDLVAQLPLLDEMLSHLAVPSFGMIGFEADDVLASWARLGREAGLPVFLMTRDKDLMQLVDDQVHLFDPGKAGDRPEVIGVDWVTAKMGVPPALVGDWLALTGDASDNVPGVAGVGPLTATKLLLEHGSLEGVLRAAPALLQKGLREKLVHGEAAARLSRELVTLRENLAVPPLEEIVRRNPDWDSLERFLHHLGMRTLLGQVRTLRKIREPHGPLFASAAASVVSASPEPVPEADFGPVNHHVVHTREDLERLADQLRRAPEAALCPLTNGVGVLVALGVAGGPGVSRGIPLSGEGAVADPADVSALLGPLLADSSRCWVVHDVKTRLDALSAAGLALKGNLLDLGLAAYLLSPGERDSDLSSQSRRRLGIDLGPSPVQSPPGRRQVPSPVSAQSTATHACRCADLVARLREPLEEDLRLQGLYNLWREVELPLLRVLHDMELAGITVDRRLIETLASETSTQMTSIEAQAHALAKRPFNLGSPRQLGEILFGDLGLEPPHRTATGQPSTDSEALEALRALHPLPAAILEHRELAKLHGTWLEPLPELLDGQGRVHTTFHQNVTATGRLSSQNPNLQNIPVRGELGRRLRRAFVAPPNHLLVAADYSQIELRLLAHFSQDEGLAEVFRSGRDIHRETAAKVGGISAEEVDADRRRAAKAVNFGVVYGMGPWALAQEIGTSVEQARRFIEAWFAAFPRVRPWMDSLLEQARRDGYVTTLLNRRRHLPGLRERNRQVRENAERMAVNTPLQGSAADLVKLGMLRVQGAIDQGLSARLLLQVHDELVLEAPLHQAHDVAHSVADLLRGVMDLSVPLVVEARAAPSWGDAH